MASGAAALGVHAVEVLRRPVEEEPEGWAGLVSMGVLAMVLPALALLLVAVLLRRRSSAVVNPLLALSAGVAGMLVMPVLATWLVMLGRTEPTYDDEVLGRGVVVYHHDPASSGTTLVPQRVAFHDQLSEQDRVDAAVNELIGSPAPAGRRSYWSLPCTRTYTGMVRVEVDAVEIELLGPPRRTTPGCRLSTRERRLQEQQLAWTVRANLDDPATPLRVRDPRSTAWAVLRADPAYVEHR
jgi:hypothetical protein